MRNKFIPSILAFLIIFLSGVVIVHAQKTPPDVSRTSPNVSRTSFENPLRVKGDLYTLLEGIVRNIVMPVGGVLAVLAFIYSGFLYVMAQGNETKLKTANKAFLYTCVGTVLLLGAWVIAEVLQETLKQIV